MTPTDLRLAGEALYGPHWRKPLANALGVDVRTVDFWIAGRYAINNRTTKLIAVMLQEHRLKEPKNDD